MKKSVKNATSPSVLPEEIAGFSALAQSWWDKSGPYAALHHINPLRLRYIQEQIQKAFSATPFRSLKILDVGCGGGLIAEGLARLGANVTGLDASENTIALAKRHAKKEGLKIDYRAETLENMAQTDQKFDVVVAMEIFEHLGDRETFVTSLAGVLKPGGLLITATLNRTWRSYLEAIVAAEFLLGWVPAGTHEWENFLKPSELASLLEKRGIFPTDITGLTFSLPSRTFEIDKHKTDVNYFLTARKR